MLETNKDMPAALLLYLRVVLALHGITTKNMQIPSSQGEVDGPAIADIVKGEFHRCCKKPSANTMYESAC
jgi:hypothetical protein